jgi:hypothetical protein
MSQPVLPDNSGAQATRPICCRIQGDPILMNLWKQSMCDGVVVHDNMVERAHMVEKTCLDPSQVVVVLRGEENSRTDSSMNETEATDLLVRNRVFQKVLMLRKRLAYISATRLKSGTGRLE